MDIGSFTPPMVVSRRRSEIWDFFFFLLRIVGGGDSHLSSSLSQLRSPTHEARRRLECLTVKPMELAADRSACLWILVLSRH